VTSGSDIRLGLDAVLMDADAIAIFQEETE
jgi:hypothetical protein